MARDLLFKVLQHQKTIRAAWVPFAGVHAGKLKGYSAKEVLQDGNKLFESILEVNKVYQPDGLPVIFDLQVEAEILGCDLHWDEFTPPTVITHPLSEEPNIPCDCCLPEINDGRLPMILEVMRNVKKAIGDTTALYGLVCGPFTLASHLRGTDIFLDMYDKPEYVLELLEFCRKVADKVASYYIEAGMDIIAFVDPLVSQISEDHFREFLSEVYSDLFNELRSKHIFSSFFVCGDATRNIEAMCQTKPDSISIDENIDIKKAKVITDQYNVAIGGNIQLTVTMLHGSQAANMKAVVDIIEACGSDNLVVAPGCDMPYDTPIENTIAASQAVLNFTESKEMIKGFDASLDFSDIEIVIPDYNNLTQPLVEVFTLDSKSCAACSYMMNIVREVHDEIPNEFEYVEYKFTEKASILRCVTMGVKNLPALYINGVLVWSSLIPSKIELINAIRKGR